jgi:hypothetical protein
MTGMNSRIFTTQLDMLANLEKKPTIQMLYKPKAIVIKNACHHCTSKPNAC